MHRDGGAGWFTVCSISKCRVSYEWFRGVCVETVGLVYQCVYLDVCIAVMTF